MLENSIKVGSAKEAKEELALRRKHMSGRVHRVKIKGNKFVISSEPVTSFIIKIRLNRYSSGYHKTYPKHHHAG